MKFTAHGIMQSCPGFNMNTKVEPIEIEGTAGASVAASIGAISASVKEIPIRLAIPFLKRRKKLPVVAVIGGFGVKLSPFGIKIEDATIRLNCTLGKNGIEGKAEGHVTCKTDMKIKGKLSGKANVLDVDFGDEDDLDVTCD